MTSEEIESSGIDWSTVPTFGDVSEIVEVPKPYSAHKRASSRAAGKRAKIARRKNR